MPLHDDDPDAPGNLSDDEYRKRAEERGQRSGACHPGVAESLGINDTDDDSAVTE